MGTDAQAPAYKMKYRFLGNTGLYVSAFSFGSWVTFDNQLNVDTAYPIMEHAFQQGVNYFDNAEVYANGKSEVVMGQCIKRGIDRGVWKRSDLVISTKLFYGGTQSPESKDTSRGMNDIGLSRKHVIEGTKASLKRFGLDYVDLLFCHRFDPRTPIEETVRAMNFCIEQGWAFYWGTSEWSAAQVIEACEIADRLHLIRPVMDQAQYNIFERSRVDYDFVTLYKKYGYGVTSWSPLASGVLTGKYNNGIPKGSRLSRPEFKDLADDLKTKVPKVVKLEDVAKEVGCTLAELALAWCLSNKHVSTTILGATSIKQLDENLKALAFVDKITPEIKKKIDDIIQFQPNAWVDMDAYIYQDREKFL